MTKGKVIHVTSEPLGELFISLQTHAAVMWRPHWNLKDASLSCSDMSSFFLNDVHMVSFPPTCITTSSNSQHLDLKQCCDETQCCGVFWRPPTLWIAPLDCKHLHPTAETNRYQIHHSIRKYLPHTLFPRVVLLHDESFKFPHVRNILRLTIVYYADTIASASAF